MVYGMLFLLMHLFYCAGVRPRVHCFDEMRPQISIFHRPVQSLPGHGSAIEYRVCCGLDILKRISTMSRKPFSTSESLQGNVLAGGWTGDARGLAVTWEQRSNNRLFALIDSF